MLIEFKLEKNATKIGGIVCKVKVHDRGVSSIKRLHTE